MANEKAQCELAKKLGKEGMLPHVRRITFRYPGDYKKVDIAFQSISESHPWVFYLSKEIGNSFYYASELVIQRMMIQNIDAKSFESKEDSADEWQDFKIILKTVPDIARELTALFMAYLIQVIEKHFGDVDATPIVKFNAPDLEEMSIPFFVER